MKEVIIKDKEEYLKKNYPFTDKPELSDKVICIHCNKTIVVGDYKVYDVGNGVELIYCSNAPECNGTLIDWWPIEDE